MNYIPPKSFYDIFPNDYVNWNFVPPVGNFAGGAPAETPRYGFQYPWWWRARARPLGGSDFPIPYSIRHDLVHALVSRHGPALPRARGEDLPESTVTPPARRKAKRTGAPRPRGPNKRRPGSGYVDMMNGLSIEVQHALQQEYANCCEVVRGKDPSTVQKHRFTRRHFERVDAKYQSVLPSFTCPAFVGLHEECKSAKFGRYDSTERHCIRCPGFEAMRTKMGSLYPFQITKGEFEAVRDYRKSKSKADPDTGVRAPALVEAALFKLMSALTGATCSPKPAVSESQPADVPEDAELEDA
ncbi:hypothetical protein EDB83DRAFT_2574818 [Lactarius deliciosus]|nr:hypothetical protein EDB83DRAFT_2574818 [Lactarius deliciosus]